MLAQICDAISMPKRRELAENNRLLMLIPDAERQAFVADLVPTALPLGRELYRIGEPTDALYFPVDSVVSLLEGAEEGTVVEMATIGNEGVVGAFCTLNPHKIMGKHLVQVAGDALRLDVRKFDEYMSKSAAFQALIHRYLFALTRQIIQAGACNQLHTTEERCARWLLMTHDRAGSDTFRLTQEFLAGMLGIRRATVNLAISTLKNAGFIRYVRGQITVIDRSGLESVSCPCYELIRREYSEIAGQ